MGGPKASSPPGSPSPSSTTPADSCATQEESEGEGEEEEVLLAWSRLLASFSLGHSLGAPLHSSTQSLAARLLLLSASTGNTRKAHKLHCWGQLWAPQVAANLFPLLLSPFHFTLDQATLCATLNTGQPTLHYNTKLNESNRIESKRVAEQLKH